MVLERLAILSIERNLFLLLDSGHFLPIYSPTKLPEINNHTFSGEYSCRYKHNLPYISGALHLQLIVTIYSNCVVDVSCLLVFSSLPCIRTFYMLIPTCQ